MVDCRQVNALELADGTLVADIQAAADPVVDSLVVGCQAADARVAFDLVHRLQANLQGDHRGRPCLGGCPDRFQVFPVSVDLGLVQDVSGHQVSLDEVGFVESRPPGCLGEWMAASTDGSNPRNH